MYQCCVKEECVVSIPLFSNIVNLFTSFFLLICISLIFYFSGGKMHYIAGMNSIFVMKFVCEKGLKQEPQLN